MKDSGTAVIILGMHRSGTSVLSRLINILGVYLGEQSAFLEADEYNAEGYWERRDIVAQNDVLLKRFDLEWHDLPADWRDAPETAQVREDLTQTLERAFGGRPLWGFKDPRTCLLLPLWKELLAARNVKPAYLIAVRNPLDVAASLLRRDNLAPVLSVLFWARYLLESLINTEGETRTCVNFDDIMSDAEGTLKPAMAAIGLPWPEANSTLETEIRGFLKPNLRHSHQTNLDNLPLTPFGDFIRELYGLALQACADHSLLSSPSFTEEVKGLRARLVDFGNYVSGIQKQVSGCEEMAVVLAYRSLSKGATAEHCQSLVRKIDMAVDRLQTEIPYYSEIVCKKGCSHCCYRQVACSSLEAVSVAHHLRQTYSQEQIDSLRERLEAYAVEAREERKEPWRFRVKCPFLVNDECSIYEMRPITCRGRNSTDVTACERRRFNARENVPIPGVYGILEVALYAGAGQMRGASAAQVTPAVTELPLAVMRMLEEPSLIERAAKDGNLIGQKTLEEWVAQMPSPP